jgi:hypothetical protein
MKPKASKDCSADDDDDDDDEQKIMSFVELTLYKLYAGPFKCSSDSFMMTRTSASSSFAVSMCSQMFQNSIVVGNQHMRSGEMNELSPHHLCCVVSAPLHIALHCVNILTVLASNTGRLCSYSLLGFVGSKALNLFELFSE